MSLAPLRARGVRTAVAPGTGLPGPIGDHQGEIVTKTRPTRRPPRVGDLLDVGALICGQCASWTCWSEVESEQRNRRREL